MKTKEIFYVSNLLSLSRVVLLIPIYYCLGLQTTTGNYAAVLFMFVAVATDNLDGRFARKLNQRSDFGRILDPIADKICVAVVSLVLVLKRDLPVWFLVLALSRDLVILLFGLFLMYKTKVVVESNKLGKVTVSALAVVLISYTLELDSVKTFFLWCTVALIAASSVSYFWKMISLMRERRSQHA